MKLSYGESIRQGFDFLLSNFGEVFILGQGLWSPWYVGNTMIDLDRKFGKSRVIDTPVSEAACTGLAIGAAAAGMKPIVVHPRMDFMMYAMDQIVNEAAKWNYMFGGNSSAGLTIRGIINRGGGQGAQHSQALHGIFAHIPGLRVVMPYSVQDARDLLVASVLSSDPVLYIDDRWLYETEAEVGELTQVNISEIEPEVVKVGNLMTLVGCGYTTKIAVEAAEELGKVGLDLEVIDLRILNPLNMNSILSSIKKTGRLIVVDGGWGPCGISAEVISQSAENISNWKSSPKRLTIPFIPAPSAISLENSYYPTSGKLKQLIQETLEDE